MFFPFVPGLDEPTYTQEQLDNIDPPPFTWEGKEYTAYSARQKQREYERNMRYCKRQMIANDAAGQEKEYNHYKKRLKKLSQNYRTFSAKAGLPLQMERVRVQGFGQREAAKARRK